MGNLSDGQAACGGVRRRRDDYIADAADIEYAHCGNCKDAVYRLAPRIAELERQLANTKFELEITENARLTDNAYLIQQREAAEAKVAELECQLAELEDKLDFTNRESTFNRLNEQRQEMIGRAHAAEAKVTELERQLAEAQGTQHRAERCEAIMEEARHVQEVYIRAVEAKLRGLTERIEALATKWEQATLSRRQGYPAERARELRALLSQKEPTA